MPGSLEGNTEGGRVPADASCPSGAGWGKRWRSGGTPSSLRLPSLMDMSLSKLQKTVKDREARSAAVYGVAQEN